MTQSTAAPYVDCRDCRWCAKESGMCLGFLQYPERAALLGASSAIYTRCAREVNALCGLDARWFEPKTPGEYSPGEYSDRMDALGLVDTLPDCHGNKGQPV